MLPEIDQQQLAQVRATAAVMVVDVRDADEYRAGHVPGARLIPLKVLGARMHELPRDTPVYLVCQSGGRSAQATRMLLGAGIRAVNVRGGTAAWIQAGQPVEHGIGTETTR
ncbi:rhodanese-like domain-containing protein [Pseudonocardia sp. GCM10023141]|uniref:rhodanese-like domain-containing protein n=1 Tax=Pseudonocardia sp. GCM10023141 TaxID=3252653 RepID=UPI00360E0C56